MRINRTITRYIVWNKMLNEITKYKEFKSMNTNNQIKSNNKLKRPEEDEKGKKKQTENAFQDFVAFYAHHPLTIFYDSYEKKQNKPSSTSDDHQHRWNLSTTWMNHLQIEIVGNQWNQKKKNEKLHVTWMRFNVECWMVRLQIECLNCIVNKVFMVSNKHENA